MRITRTRLVARIAVAAVALSVLAAPAHAAGSKMLVIGG